MSSHRGLRVVPGIEATKGLLILLAGFGVLELIHHGVQHVAEELVRHSHLNPASRYPRIFVHAASEVTDARLWLLAAAAALYASPRLVEAYGLWRRRRWAKWFGVLTGASISRLESSKYSKA